MLTKNREFYVKYLQNQSVKIETHFNGENQRTRPLKDIADLVASIKQALPSKLGAIDLDELTLHLPVGVTRSALEEDCFATVDENDTTLDTGCPLSALSSLGSKSKHPLIIKSGIGGTAMDIDSASQRAPPFVRTKSDEEFIQTNNLDLRKPEDSLTYLIHLLEKYISYKAINLPNNANFYAQTCLEHRLDKRATKYVPDLVDNVKLVLAVSGAGKTRMLLELLYSTWGYYFTAKSSVKDFGSADLGECRVYCDYHPEDAKRAIQLLYFIRVSVCNYLISEGFKDPKSILLAQLHPTAFFGSDVFEQLFTALVKEPIFNATQIVEPFPVVAIDEIQVTLEGEAVYHLSSSSKKRPFFSPLVQYSKLMNIFPTFLLSGTGINFQFVKEAMESGTMKRHQFTAYEVVSDFHPLLKSQVESYAAQFLKDQEVAEADDIVSRISAFELCHGRPRFVAYILDGYMESKDIDLSIGEFVSGITNVDGQIYPLRFFKRDLESNTISLNRTISGSTLGDTIRNGLLSLVLRGKLVLTVTDEDGAAAIRYGLGFGGVTEGMLREVEINELAVIECLRVFVPFSDLVLNFAKQISACPQPQMVGYLLEYLVAFALVANFSNDADAVSRIYVTQKFCHEYLRFVDASQVCFPDHMCGPDIIYKCSATKTVYIVQVKFVMEISKQETVNACDTTDPERFYCKRKGNGVLKGFEQRRSQLRESLTQLQRDGYSLQQMLFIHTGGNQTLFTQGALVVTKSSHPSFFSMVNSGIWDFLDSVRSSF